MYRYILFIILNISAACANANEQEKAIAECEVASAKAMENEKTKMDLVGLCPTTDRSYRFWVCMNERISDGETFLYAGSQCEENSAAGTGE